MSVAAETLRAVKSATVHRVSALSLSQYLSDTIRELRCHRDLTIADLAAQAGISRSMLSKIENGRTSTSLQTLSNIAAALGVSLMLLLSYYNVPADAAQHVTGCDAMKVMRRGTRRGHIHQLLTHDREPCRLFEPVLVTINDISETFPLFDHPGVEFIYLLTGKMEYRHGPHTYHILPGDSLTFRGEVSHGPVRLIMTPIIFLSLIIY